MKVKGLQGPHHVTATAAAVADEGYFALHIVPRLRQARLLALAQNIYRLVFRDGSGNPIPAKTLGNVVEGEARLSRSVAGLSQMLCRMVTLANPYRYCRRRRDNMCCPFPIEDLSSVIRREDLLSNERSKQLCLPMVMAAGEPIRFVEVVLKETRKFFHRDVGAGTHEREFKEANHDRRQGEVSPASVLDIKYQSPAGHVRQLIAQFIAGNSEVLRQRLKGGEIVWESRCQYGIFRREQRPQDLCQGR